MAVRGQKLCPDNTAVVADQADVQWQGGRTAFVIVASTYPTTCKLQMKMPDGSTYVDVNGTTVSANALPVLYDLAAGIYRLHLASGTVAGMYASMVSVPYL